MRGVYLPGGSKVSIRVVTDPEPGPGQVLVRPRASTICGSDLRAIYREHVGEGAEAYQGVVAGHEPCGDVVAVGPGCLRAAVGDRVVVYHISGCGLCDDCRRGYQVGCTSTARRAYGWQRDGGHADLLLAEERDLLP
nr:alcohol dehydrogenase catalytic domain-containing protein [Actinomycetota bacterium]